MNVTYVAAYKRVALGFLAYLGFFGVFFVGNVLVHEVAHFAGAGTMPTGIRFERDADSFTAENSYKYWLETSDGLGRYEHTGYHFNGIVIYDNLWANAVSLGLWTPYEDADHRDGITATLAEAFIPEPDGVHSWSYGQQPLSSTWAPTAAWAILAPVSFWLCWRHPRAWTVGFAMATGAQPLCNVHHWTELNIPVGVTYTVAYAVLLAAFLLGTRYFVVMPIRVTKDLIRQGRRREQLELDLKYGRQPGTPAIQWTYTPTLRRD